MAGDYPRTQLELKRRFSDEYVDKPSKGIVPGEAGNRGARVSFLEFRGRPAPDASSLGIRQNVSMHGPAAIQHCPGKTKAKQWNQ
jgi:hypothetical protein